MLLATAVVLALAGGAGALTAAAQAPETPRATGAPIPLDALDLPPGFRIALWARGVANARQMALGSKGTVFVGSRGAGNVYAVTDRDGDGTADHVRTLATGLNQPNGVAFRAGALYVAEVHRIIRFDDIEARLAKPPDPVVVTDTLPSDHHHGWKFIAFGPDGRLYVAVGMPCDVCEPPSPLHGTILRMQPDGSGLETFARGIRNSVGFDWHPRTKVLWFTDNGRDGLGDDRPPDELNRAPEPGLHFGFPYCHGADLRDPTYGKTRTCDEFQAPARELGPHVAALGMRFYTGTMFPTRYRNQVFVAEHGSWNRSEPIGYRVSLVRVADGKALGYEPFATGWLQGVLRRSQGQPTVAIGKAFGRPVDVLVMPDGALLVSDDEGGNLYRITYEE